MNRFFTLLAAVVLITPVAHATQADDTITSVTGQSAGPTAFISKLNVLTSDTAVLRSIQFTIAPKPGSVTRPLSATYSAAYLKGRGYLDAASGQITLPVWGLYSGYNNAVTLKYVYNDGSAEQEKVSINAPAYSDSCEYDTPTVLQARTDNTELSYDFIFVASACSPNSPTIIDTDGLIRWVGNVGVVDYPATFYDNAVFIADGPRLLRIDMDGTVTVIADYTSQGVRKLHHNIDRGKYGLAIQVTTQDYIATVEMEVDPVTGKILKTWNMADIISAEMKAGGDDPTQFVKKVTNGDYEYTSPADWWHENSAAYRHSDDSFIMSSRENFVICLDYETKAIKWIFGDDQKQWHQYPSLRKYALSVAPGGVLPFGQHAVSITKDDHLLLFDNGRESQHHAPRGMHRAYSAPRKYSLDLDAKVATEVWSYPNGEGVFTPFCSSVYEDAPFNYLVDYALVGGFGPNATARILGVTAKGDKVFDYSVPTTKCDDAYRSFPLHFEDVSFPTSDVQLANISSRSLVTSGDHVAIAGFIVSGSAPKPVVIRGLGPSLKSDNQPLPGRLPDPTLTLYDDAGKPIATNDNYGDAPASDQAVLAQTHLAPSNAQESAIVRTLSAGAYTAVLRGGSNTTGIGLVELYDINTSAKSKLANLSSRSYVSTDNDVLIGGLLLRGNAIKRVLFRGIGPELQNAGLQDALPDTNLQVVDRNGTTIATNDDWRDANNAREIQQTGLQPAKDKESAVLMPMLAGDYTVILTGKGESGAGLLEIYQLD